MVAPLFTRNKPH